MILFISKRILMGLPVVFGVISLTIIFMYIIPGDPVRAMVGDYYNEDATIDNKEQYRVPIENEKLYDYQDNIDINNVKHYISKNLCMEIRNSMGVPSSY